MKIRCVLNCSYSLLCIVRIWACMVVSGFVFKMAYVYNINIRPKIWIKLGYI